MDSGYLLDSPNDQDLASPGTPLEVVVVAEDPLARSALSMLLTGQGMSVATVTSGGAAGDARADVAVWDLGADTRQAQERIDEMDAAPQRVVALLPDATHAPAAFAAGARGLLLRETNGPSLGAALRAVAAGLVVVDPALATAVVPARERAPLAAELTTRESEVLQLLSAGLSNKEIAARMKISDHTVKFHVNAILTKLGVSSRTEAVVQAAKRGLVIL